MLTVRGVSKEFGKKAVLTDVSLEFESGIYGLLAPNAAGKTTLIKLLATLLFPTKGEILYGGTDIAALGEMYREKLGYLPQEFGYYKSHSPRRYLEYLAVLKGVVDADEQIDTLLDLLALSDVKDKKMSKFSGGMVRRVGIAQALLGDPDILILDEPTSGLDPNERARFGEIISDYANRGKTVIFSTHIVSDVENAASMVVMLKDQGLLYCDSPAGICGALGAGSLEDAYALVYMDGAG